MERHFDEELAALKHALMEMCETAESMISGAVAALVNADPDLLNHLDQQERKLDRFQVDIDEACVRLVALYQPTASDLRFLFGVARINTSIERLGDKALSIGRTAGALMHFPPLKPYETIPQMASIASTMVHESIHSFVGANTELARQVLHRDNVLDKLKNAVVTELLSLMRQDSDAIERGMRLVLLAKNLERIGDLSCNIAEDIIFMVEGEDVRHQEDHQF